MLSIVTVNYRSGPRLATWLESIRRHPPSEPYEIVVADNASDDGSADLLREPPPGVRVLWLPKNLLYTGAMNEALAAAKGDLVLLLNPDVYPQEGSIDALLSRLRASPDAGGVTGPTLRPADLSFEKYVNRFPRPYDIYLTQFVRPERAARNAGYRRYHMMEERFDEVREVPQPAGHCILYRRELLGERPMSPDLGMFFSDVEVATKVHRAGKRILFDPAARFVHDHPRVARPPTEQGLLMDLDYYVGCARYFRRYVGRGAALQVKLLFGARLLGRLLLIELPRALRGIEPWSLWRQRARVLGWFLRDRNVLLEGR